MAEEKKERKGPSESATANAVGTKKKGNDGVMWTVIETSAGIRRWKRDAKKNGQQSLKSTQTQTKQSWLDNMTTKYYGMADARGQFVSMPLISMKTDKYAVIEFSSEKSIGSFAGYKTGFGTPTLTAAKKMRGELAAKSPRMGFVIYKLSMKRGEKNSRM